MMGIYPKHDQDTGGKIVHVFRFQKLNLILIWQETSFFVTGPSCTIDFTEI
jgi:hypothetical protein